MKFLLACTIGLVTLTSLNAQNYLQKFGELRASKDTVAQRILLDEWERQNSDDPELYTCYFNYYVQMSRVEIVRMDKRPVGSENLQLKDSTNNVVEYLYSETKYRSKNLDAGFEMINKGIAKFPNRLDMRFGKIYMLGEIDNMDAFAEEIIKAIDYSVVNSNHWQWTMNEAVQEPRQFLLDNIQTYVGELFNMGEDQARNIRRIAEATLRNYPDHSISLSNLGISYIFENNYTEALKPLLAAEVKAPTDAIVLGNIAYVYMALNDKKKASEYYRKVIKYGNDDARRFAEEQLELLKG